MNQPTTERLAQALEALNDPALVDMIQKAREGYYDDFKSPLATPQIQLYKDLLARDHLLFAQRVVNGEFDATAEEGEQWWRDEGRSFFKGVAGPFEEEK